MGPDVSRMLRRPQNRGLELMNGMWRAGRKDITEVQWLELEDWI